MDKPSSCRHCGAAVSPTARFCEQCGGALSAPPPAPGGVKPATASGKPAPSLPPDSLQWEAEVPLLTNRFILYDFVKLLVISILVMEVLLVVMTIALDRRLKLETLAAYVKLGGVAMLGLGVIMILVMLLFFWNRFPMRFTLEPRGAMVESLSRRGKVGNRLAFILGMLARRPGVAGAGLLGMSQETVSVTWPEVHRVKVHEARRVISLMNSWRVVFRLYCTPENFAPVLAAVAGWADKGRKSRARAARRAGPSPLPRLLLITGLALVAGVALGALPLEVPGLLRLAVVLLGLAALWLPPLSRFLGVATLMAVALVVLIFVIQGLEVRQLHSEETFRAYAASRGLQVDTIPDWALGKYRRFSTLHGGDWIAAGVAGLGLLVFTGIGLGALRGRLRPDSPGTPQKP
jgi:hypothetical protein